jgi:2-polyprenyl-3-methyl-5-hydroxy-6-metoxy-1,4-benzoquinol methylase
MSEKLLLQTELPLDVSRTKLSGVPCPICGRMTENHQGRVVLNSMELHLDYCIQDDLWRLNPRPDEAFYEVLYRTLFYHSPIPEQFGYASMESNGARRRDKAVLNWNDIESHCPDLRKGRFLEIGCATGEMLSEAAARGWEHAAGVEIEEECCAVARSQGLDIHRASAEQLPQFERSFDLIFADNVIEHLMDPKQAALNFSKLQGPGDYLVLRLPDTPPEGPTLKLIDHTFHFSRSSMTSLLDLCGYATTEIFHSGTYLGTNPEDRIDNMTVVARRV